MIYLDNAATTWPKPEETVAAMEDCLRNAGANPGRGGHGMSLAAGRIIFETREKLAGLFNVKDAARIIFTGNATESLNLALKGSLGPGDHVVTGSMEHNAVVRPLFVLQQRGVEVTTVKSDKDGFLDPQNIKSEIKENTRAVVVMHASNVTGTIMPIGEIGKITREAGINLLVDAAQTAGYLDIDVEEMNVDLLAFTGHKNLYGPQGTGGIYIREGIGLEPLIEGGTGSKSEAAEQPGELPDKYESGTPNTPGIAGLGAGVGFITAMGLKQARQHEQALVGRFLDGLKQIKRLEMYGPDDPKRRVPVVSINIKGRESSEISFALDRVFGIACRGGLHCAPAAHKTIGTIDRGAVRFSFSVFNKSEEVDQTLKALEQITAEM